MAGTLCTLLEERGLRCFLASRDVPMGEPYAAAIARAIASSRALLLLLSSSSNFSAHVAREVGIAIDRSLPVLPVKLDAAAPRGELEYFVGRLHALDASGIHTDAEAQARTALMQLLPHLPRRGAPPDAASLRGRAVDPASAEGAAPAAVERQRLRFSLDQRTDITFVLIPAGCFTMGSPPDEAGHNASEEPLETLELCMFYLSETPVTRAQWRVVSAWEPVRSALSIDPARWGQGEHPVVNVTWDQATEFCARLEGRYGLRLRLPSEAEWEYACRSGTSTPFWCGTQLAAHVANFAGQSRWPQRAPGVMAVGTTGAPNGFGLCDMHGNVWEWCADAWFDSLDGYPRNGRARVAAEGQLRVVRGGAWCSSANDCRSARRGRCPRGTRSGILGFRVACDAFDATPDRVRRNVESGPGRKPRPQRMKGKR